MNHTIRTIWRRKLSRTFVDYRLFTLHQPRNPHRYGNSIMQEKRAVEAGYWHPIGIIRSSKTKVRTPSVSIPRILLIL